MLAVQGELMLMLRSPARPQQGFTIIEMAIAMAIFGFLLAAALPSIGTWMDNTRIRNAAESIQNGLQTARAEAIRRNQSVSFWLVSSDDALTLTNDCTLSHLSGSWIVSVNDPTGQCAAAPSSTTAPMIILKRPIGDAGSRVSITALQSDGITAGQTVTFNGFGRVSNTTPISQIDITGLDAGTDYRPLRVQIASTGMVRMCDPNPSLSVDDPRRC